MTGLTFLNPFGFLALSGLVFVGIIYFFYRRYKPRKISGLFLWESSSRPTRGGRQLTRPVVSRSLLLDLAAVFCLALAFASPAIMTSSPAGLILILDNTFSMRAHNNHVTVRQWAGQLLTHAENRHSGPRQVVILTAGDKPGVLFNQELYRPNRDVLKALDQYDPYDSPDDSGDSLTTCITLARELVAGPVDIHIFTDQNKQLATAPGISAAGARERLFFHTIKGCFPNHAIVEAWRRVSQDGTGENCLIGLANYTPHDSEAQVILRDSHQELARRSLSLKAGSIANVSFQLQPVQDQLTIAIQVPPQLDILDTDSRVCLLPAPRLSLSYMINLQDGETREAVERALLACGDTVSLDKLNGINTSNSSNTSNNSNTANTLPALLITSFEPPIPGHNEIKPLKLLSKPLSQPPGSSNEKRAGLGGKGTVMTLAIGNGGGVKRSHTGMALTGPYIVDLRHPLCRDLDFTGVYWVPVQENMDKKQVKVPLVAAGELPLYYFAYSPLYSPQFHEYDELVLNLQVFPGNITRHPAWPILFANLVCECRERLPGLHQSNYYPGEFLHWINFPDSSFNPGYLMGENLQRSILSTTSFTAVPSKPGIYRLYYSHSDRELAQIAVNSCVREESDLQGLAVMNETIELTAGGIQSGNKNNDFRNGRFSLYSWFFLLIGVILILINWILEKREVIL